MMLRVSTEMRGETVDLTAIVSDEPTSGNVPAGEELVQFVDTVLAPERAGELADARARLQHAVGDGGLVDAAGVIGNFQRMVRIADGTGIPLDDVGGEMMLDIRDQLALDRFPSASRSPRPG